MGYGGGGAADWCRRASLRGSNGLDSPLPGRLSSLSFPSAAAWPMLLPEACGLLCRGFARMRCEECGESQLVALSCRARGFCLSRMGRRMSPMAANLIERVLPPQSGLRQWVLTFPFLWRWRLAQDGALFGKLTRIFVATVQTFYAERAAWERAPGREDRRGHGGAEDASLDGFTLHADMRAGAQDAAGREALLR